MSEIYSLSRMSNRSSRPSLNQNQLTETDVNQNQLAQFMRESFLITNEWMSYRDHTEILNFAETMGYRFSETKIREQAFRAIGPKNTTFY